MVPQMTPMVAAVPKAVPVRTERRQLSRKVMSRKTAGRMALAAKETMTGMRARLPPQSREQTDEKEIEQYIFGGAYAGEGEQEDILERVAPKEAV